MTKSCDNCRFGGMEDYLEKCWGGAKMCFDNPEHPNWAPMTNADKVRTMSDKTLAEMFAKIGGTEEKWLEWLQEVAESAEE